MKNLSVVSLSVLSVLVFDAVTAAERNGLDMLVASYKSGNLNNVKVLIGDASVQSEKDKDVTKKALNRGKEKAEEMFDSVKGTAKNAKNEINRAIFDDTSSSGTDDVENRVKNLGKKSKKEVKNTSNKVEDNVKEVSDNVKEDINKFDRDESKKRGSKFNPINWFKGGNDLEESSASDDEGIKHLLDDPDVNDED